MQHDPFPHYHFPPKNIEFSAKKIAEHLSLPVSGNIERVITGMSGVGEPVSNTMTFLSSKARLNQIVPQLIETGIGAIIVPEQFSFPIPDKIALIESKNPSNSFFELISLFYPERAQGSGKVHPTAIVPKSCTIGDNVDIAPYVVIGENVTIGANTIVNAHTTIYDNCNIGSHCLIHSGVHIREGVTLGDLCTIQNGAIIGADGFGYAPDPKVGIRPIPQVGTVEIGDRVDIGALTAVDRATLGTTKINHSTKLDNMVQIGHNVQVGSYSLLCAQVGVAGSSKIGDQVTIGGQAGVADHRKIGNTIRVAGASAVTANLTKPGDYQGIPAVPTSKWKKQQVFLRKLSKYGKDLFNAVKIGKK